MAYKLLVIEATTDHDCYGDDCYCEPSVQTRELSSLTEAAKLDFNLRQELAYLLGEMLKSGDDVLLDTLKAQGWVNANAVEDREKKLALGKQFWLIEAGRGNYTHVEGFDFDKKMSDHHVRRLAEDGINIAQVVKKPTLKKMMTSHQKGIYERERKRLAAEKEKRAAAAKTRREKKKAKEIEKAKKVLADAGELDG